MHGVEFCVPDLPWIDQQHGIRFGRIIVTFRIYWLAGRDETCQTSCRKTNHADAIRINVKLLGSTSDNRNRAAQIQDRTCFWLVVFICRSAIGQLKRRDALLV